MNEENKAGLSNQELSNQLQAADNLYYESIFNETQLTEVEDISDIEDED